MSPSEPHTRSSAQSLSILAWLAVALGQAAFVAVHFFEYFGVLATEVENASGHGHGHDHDHLSDVVALGEPATMWMVVGWSALTLAPAVIALIAKRARGVWAVLGTGVFSVIAAILDGALHAFMDESLVSLVAAVVLVGVPGAIAAVATRRWVAGPTAAV